MRAPNSSDVKVIILRQVLEGRVLTTPCPLTHSCCSIPPCPSHNDIVTCPQGEVNLSEGSLTWTKCFCLCGIWQMVPGWRDRAEMCGPTPTAGFLQPCWRVLPFPFQDWNTLRLRAWVWIHWDSSGSFWKFLASRRQHMHRAVFTPSGQTAWLCPLLCGGWQALSLRCWWMRGRNPAS